MALETRVAAFVVGRRCRRKPIFGWLPCLFCPGAGEEKNMPQDAAGCMLEACATQLEACATQLEACATQLEACATQLAGSTILRRRPSACFNHSKRFTRSPRRKPEIKKFFAASREPTIESLAFPDLMPIPPWSSPPVLGNGEAGGQGLQHGWRHVTADAVLPAARAGEAFDHVR